MDREVVLFHTYAQKVFSLFDGGPLLGSLELALGLKDSTNLSVPASYEGVSRVGTEVLSFTCVYSQDGWIVVVLFLFLLQIPLLVTSRGLQAEG